MENPELELARRFVERTATSVFLTGKAGTGKTTFLRELRARSPKRMIVLAPTGVAAINAGGVTIHSFFQLAFAPYVPESERGIAPDRPREAVRFSRQKIAIIKSIDLLVIDEISMVRADVLDAVSDVLRRFRDRRKPFGGVQLLLIGDVQQLAPVVRDEEWALLRTFYDSPFFFDSKALKQTDYVGIELQRVYRQSDGRFVELLNRVRDGRVDRNVLDELNRRYVPGFRPGDDEGYITLTSHNHTADAINERRLAELDAPSHTFEAEIEGAFPEYLYPTHPSLTLRKGAQVMFVKNDPSPEKRYYNGRIGTVTALDENRVEVLPRGESVPIAVEPAEWTNAKYVIDPDSKEISERIEGRFVQYPLRTAWAITIHKSQGLTFDRAVIDAAASFSHGQVYVALSRCRSLDGLVLSSPLDERCIVGDPTVQGFCERVSSERPDGTELERRSRAYYRDLLLELFDFDSLGASLRRLGDFVAEHFGNLYPKLALQWQQGTAEFGASVTDVARRFRLQLESLLRSDESERLRERVVKGAAYFRTMRASRRPADRGQLCRNRQQGDAQGARRPARSFRRAVACQDGHVGGGLRRFRRVPAFGSAGSGGGRKRGDTDEERDEGYGRRRRAASRVVRGAEAVETRTSRRGGRAGLCGDEPAGAARHCESVARVECRARTYQGRGSQIGRTLRGTGSFDRRPLSGRAWRRPRFRDPAPGL